MRVLEIAISNYTQIKAVRQLGNCVFLRFRAHFYAKKTGVQKKRRQGFI